MPAPLVIAPDDPRRDDVRALVARHLAHAAEHTRPGDAHSARDADGLVDPTISFFTARRDGVLLGMGALRELAADHGELKSMHTAAEARRQGVAAALLAHLVELGGRRGYTRLSLETGAGEAFAPALALYAAAGFVRCGPFADYPDTGRSAFMELRVRRSPGPVSARGARTAGPAPPGSRS